MLLAAMSEKRGRYPCLDAEMTLHIWHPDLGPSKAICGEQNPNNSLSPDAARQYDPTLLCPNCAELLLKDGQRVDVAQEPDAA